jgi:hypothetical protein
MKFVTIYHSTGLYNELTPAESKKRNVASVELTIEVKKKLGDKFRFFAVPGYSPDMLITITDVAGPEEFRTIMQSIPSLNDGAWEYETYAVAEQTEKGMEAFLAVLRAAK